MKYTTYIDIIYIAIAIVNINNMLAVNKKDGLK